VLILIPYEFHEVAIAMSHEVKGMKDVALRLRGIIRMAMLGLPVYSSTIILKVELGLAETWYPASRYS
jgi:hypothetical protein